MDMKKILENFNSVTKGQHKTVEGVNDMKKFVSIIKESSNPYKKVDETVINSFDEGSVGGDANEFLLAADKINDEVMAQVNKIKIHADEANLRDMMEKFNAFMTAYHNVGKEIIQPDMFNDSMGEEVAEGGHPKTWHDVDKKLGKAVDKMSQAEKVKKGLAHPNTMKKKEQNTKEGLSFKDYAALAEAKKKITASEDPCWKGYKMVGTKKKGGKEVPNCVPGTKGD